VYGMTKSAKFMNDDISWSSGVDQNRIQWITKHWIDAYNLLYVVYAKSFKIKFSCPSKFSLNCMEMMKLVS